MRDLGSPNDRFRRAINSGSLPIAEAALREMGSTSTADALEVVVLMARNGDPRFAQAGARWVAKLTAARDLSVEEARRALAMIELLPEVPETVTRLRRIVDLGPSGLCAHRDHFDHVQAAQLNYRRAA